MERAPDVEMDEASTDGWVRIISVDKFSFLVRRSVAQGSGTLKSIFSEGSDFKEAQSATYTMQERAVVVEKLLEYLTYKNLYMNASQREDIPDFQERIIPEIALELLMAADFYEQ